MLDKIVEILTFGYEKLDRKNCKDVFCNKFAICRKD